MRILKDSLIYLVGELVSKSLPFLMLPYLTRKLGTEGFGELSLYLTMLSLFGIVIGMSQEGAVTRYFYFYGKYGLGNIIKAATINAAIAPRTNNNSKSENPFLLFLSFNNLKLFIIIILLCNFSVSPIQFRIIY